MKIEISIPFGANIARWVRKKRGGTWYLCRRVTVYSNRNSKTTVEICRWKRECDPDEHVIKMEQYK